MKSYKSLLLIIIPVIDLKYNSRDTRKNVIASLLCIVLTVPCLNFQKPWLTRAFESFKNVLANLAVVFQNLQAQQNFHWPWPGGRGLS